jgi:hypothetical protein
MGHTSRVGPGRAPAVRSAAKPEVAEEAEPGKAALLVGPQAAVEAGRGRHRLQTAVGGGQQVADPTLGVDRHHGETCLGGLEPERGP